MFSYHKIIYLKYFILSPRILTET